MALAEAGLQPFSQTGYEIFDDAFARTGEVVIWARRSRAPQVGDRFNVQAGGALHDLAVGEVRSFAGGWTATCRADG